MSRQRRAPSAPFVPPFEVVHIGPCTLIRGDCREVLSWYGVGVDAGSLEAIHACVSDPPYELGFMGKSWDKAGGVASDPATWGCVLDVLRPGAHLLAFAGSRTYHRIATAIEDAGAEIRDQLMWIYGSGFPKSLDVAKAIDASDAKSETPEDVLSFTAWMRSTGITARQIKDATGTCMGSHYLTDGEQPAVATAEHFDKLRPLLPPVPAWVERLVADRSVRARAKSANLARRAVVGHHDKQAQAARWRESYGIGSAAPAGAITSAFTPEAQTWEGWGTALKPAHEPIAMARKPFRGTVAGCVLAHGTGGINVDACRTGDDGGTRVLPGVKGNPSAGVYGDGLNGTKVVPIDAGRWPANVLTDGSLEVLEHFPPSARDAIRFFYAPKADKAEREFGLGSADKQSGESIKGRKLGSAGSMTVHSGLKNTARANIHPTVKPVDLMAWLCRLVTPPGGIVLDPFMGSGSTGIAAVRHGFRFVGIEQSREYFDIACRRVSAAVQMEETMPSLEREITKAVRAQQLALFEGAAA